jgi:hypothetical protein
MPPLTSNTTSQIKDKSKSKKLNETKKINEKNNYKEKKTLKSKSKKLNEKNNYKEKINYKNLKPLTSKTNQSQCNVVPSFLTLRFLVLGFVQSYPKKPQSIDISILGQGHGKPHLRWREDHRDHKVL